MRQKTTVTLVIILLLSLYSGWLSGQDEELSQWVENGLFQEAEAFCLSADGDEQNRRFVLLAETCAEKNLIDAALYYFQKSKNFDRMNGYLQQLEEFYDYSGEIPADPAEAEIHKTIGRWRERMTYETTVKPLLRPREVQLSKGEAINIFPPLPSIKPDELPVPLKSDDWKDWDLEPAPFPSLTLTIKDDTPSLTVMGQFPDRTVSSGDHMLNINNTMVYSVHYPNLPNLKYLLVKYDDGTVFEKDLSRYRGAFTIGSRYSMHSTQPGNSPLLRIVTFTGLNANKLQTFDPIYVIFRNLKYYNAVRTVNVPKMDLKYICNPFITTNGINKPRGCINRFDYKYYITGNNNWLRALDYYNWTEKEKDIFYGFLERLESRGYLDFDNFDPAIMRHQCELRLNETEIKKISLLYAAHSVFMEVNGKLNWSVENMEPELLQTLFHPDNLYLNRGNDYMAHYFIDTHPNNIGDWAVKMFMCKTPEETIYALDDWVGKHVIHNRNDLNPPCLQHFNRFNNSSPRVTMGCAGTSQYITSIARSLNIPAKVFLIYHTTYYFPTLDKGPVHGDDPYDNPLYSLDNPFAHSFFGLYSARFYYRSFDPPTGYRHPKTRSAKSRQVFQAIENIFDTSHRRLDFLHLHPDSYIFIFSCRKNGYNELKGFMNFLVAAYGESEYQRLYCCSLFYLPHFVDYAADNCADWVKKDRSKSKCPPGPMLQHDCYDVRYTPVYKLNLFPKNSPEEQRFMAGTEVPEDFLLKLRNEPNFVPVINDGWKLTPWEVHQFKFINRYVLKSGKTKILLPW